MSTFEQELMEKLPSDVIHVSVEKGLAVYYDWHGITFRKSEAEQQIVKDYITRVIEAKTGFPVRVTEWSGSNNGHFADRFERA